MLANTNTCQITWAENITTSRKQTLLENFDALKINLLKSADIQIYCNNDQLTLTIKSLPDIGEIHSDFNDAKHQHLQQTLNLSNSPLAKAFGIKKTNQAKTILDATAGWGEDSFQLHTLGCNVQSLEQHPILALLLKDAIEHYNTDSNTTWQSQCIDHSAFLNASNEQWDGIYFDMMFVPKNYSAKPNKKMQCLHSIIKPNELTQTTWELATNKTPRVVIKQPRNPRRKIIQTNFTLPKPTFQILGKTVRFDVFQKPFHMKQQEKA